MKLSLIFFAILFFLLPRPAIAEGAYYDASDHGAFTAPATPTGHRAFAPPTTEADEGSASIFGNDWPATDRTAPSWPNLWNAMGPGESRSFGPTAFENPWQSGPSTFENPSERQPRSYLMERQQGSNWCWAASIFNVLTQFGVQTSQAKVVSSFFGRPVNASAQGADQLVTTVRKYGLNAYSSDLHHDTNQLLETLRSGRKVLALTWPVNGHIVVFQEVDRNGNIVVSDPANGATGSYSIAALFSKWRWHGSVVVDPPSPGGTGAEQWNRWNQRDPQESPNGLPNLTENFAPPASGTSNFAQLFPPAEWGMH